MILLRGDSVTLNVCCLQNLMVQDKNHWLVNPIFFSKLDEPMNWVGLSLQCGLTLICSIFSPIQKCNQFCAMLPAHKSTRHKVDVCVTETQFFSSYLEFTVHFALS